MLNLNIHKKEGGKKLKFIESVFNIQMLVFNCANTLKTLMNFKEVKRFA